MSDLDRKPGSQTPLLVTEDQMNRPFSGPTEITASRLPPYAGGTPVATIIDCFGINRFKVGIARLPANMDAVTGLMTGITDYSVKIWLGGGRHQDIDPHTLVADAKNAFWFEANNCDFAGLGGHSFCEWFETHGWRWAFVQVYGTVFVAPATLYIVTNP